MLTESNSVLEDVELPPKFSAKMWISVARPKDGHYPQGNYTLDVVQTQISNGKPGVFGGVSYEINTGAPRDSD